METPIQIDFQDTNPPDSVRQMLAEQVQKLEKRYGRITACRIVIKGPGQHHRTGGLYQAHIHLSLPNGKEVDVGRVNQADERYSDLHFAINETFKRARRRLQDQARKLQGDIKHNEGPPLGIVTRIDDSGDFGFIQTPDGREIYFHKNSVLNGGFAKLRPGDRVAFAEEVGNKGEQASTVRPAGRHGLA